MFLSFHVRTANVELPDYVHYLVCDDTVIVCGLENGEIWALHADTAEVIFVSGIQNVQCL